MTDHESLLQFWREAGPQKWFAKDAAFDARFRTDFMAQHEQAAAGALDGWLSTADSALALILLLDQFPRNAFRNTPRMFATDAAAREAAWRALERGFDEQADSALRVFFYLPFEHSEDIRDQQHSLTLHERIGMTDWARVHYDIIERFGRFPHRNAVLGRTSTPEEERFLAEGGFSG